MPRTPSLVRLAAGGALVGLLATTAPTGALPAGQLPAGRHSTDGAARAGVTWDTIFKLHGTKVQACRSLAGGDLYAVKLRVDNRKGKYLVRYEKHVARGRRPQGAILKNIARGRTKTAAPMAAVFIDQTLKTSLWLGNRPKASKKTKLSKVGACVG